jgi:3-(3-hydroxy-phenyl)propionate hydroxylase
VLFLGDAAHLVPIFGVRGLNSGVADAMNAAWKLAWVLHGRAPEQLLDSYSPERRGATVDVFENASKSTRFMTPPTRGEQRMRDAVLALAVHNDFPRPLINPRQSLPYTYVESPLTTPCDAAIGGGLGVGAPLANRRMGDGSFLLDHLGHGFTLIVFVDKTGVPRALQQLTTALGSRFGGFKVLCVARAAPAADSSAFLRDVLIDDSGDTFALYGATTGTCYLVRPDRHICARWHDPHADDIKQALQRACGIPYKEA